MAGSMDVMDVDVWRFGSEWHSPAVTFTTGRLVTFDTLRQTGSASTMGTRRGTYRLWPGVWSSLHSLR